MKRFKEVLCLLLVTMLVFTACGTKELQVEPDATTTEEKTVVKEEDKGVSDEKVEAVSGLEGEVVYWSMWNQTEAQGKVLNEAINDFMAKNPNVKVKVEWKGRESAKLLQPALDNGEAIDIYDHGVETVVKEWQKYSLNLEDYMSKNYPQTGGKSYEDSVLGSLVGLARGLSDDGDLYAVPYQPYVFAFMYNKEHFQEAGIDAVPTTWEEFMAACEKLKSKGYEPITSDDAYVETLIGTHLARLKGVDFVEELVQDKSNALWDDPAVLQMAKQFEECATKGYFSKNIATNKFPAGQQDVAFGTVSMYLNGTWLVNEIMASTGPDFKWGTFTYPAFQGGKDGITAATYGSQAFAINKKSASKDAAFALLVHLTVGEWDSALAKESFGVPVSGEAVWPTQLEDAKVVFNALDQQYPYGAGIYADNDKLPIIKEGFTKLVAGEVTAEEFIALMKQ